MTQTPHSPNEPDAAEMVVVLAPQRGAAANVRRVLADFIGDRVTGASLQDAYLVASEVVANAVLHGQGEVVVRASLADERLHLSVTDSGDGSPVLRPADPARVGGFGLQIVDRLSSSWGVAPFPGGKTVWVVIDL